MDKIFSTQEGVDLRPDTQSQITATANFFNQLYEKIPEPHFAYLWTKQHGIYSFAIANETQRETMAKKAIELSLNGVDVYHSVNPVSIEPTISKRGDELAVSYQIAIVVDIDIRSDAHKGDHSFLAADFDEAKSFLPFTPSLIIFSGYGLHAYYIFDTPIKITNENREELKHRNNLMLDVIRARANGKKIDGVGDLPRVLRTPSTFNYKLGVDNAPLCHVIEDSSLRFSPTDLDEHLNALIQAQVPKAQSANNTPIKPAQKFNEEFTDDRDFNIFRVRRMLDFINPANLTYDDWLAVGMALKNIGMDCSDWENWSRADERFKDGECQYKWNGFNRDGYDIGTLFVLTHQNGYDAKEIYREWYDLHPSLRPSAKRKMDNDTKLELDDAIIWLDTLNPENFTANDARDFKHIHSVALAVTYGFVTASEKFFSVIKKAKELARIRLKDAESGLTAKLTEIETNEISALIEGVHLETIRRSVDREVTALSKLHSDFLKDETQKKKREEAKKKQVEEIAKYKSNEEQLKAPCHLRLNVMQRSYNSLTSFANGGTTDREILFL